MSAKDDYCGCLLGLALGDALGAPYEGGPIERLLWLAIGRTSEGLRRWTDDTQMSLDLGESVVELGRLDPDDAALRFGASYRWSRGYGPSAAKVLKRIRGGVPWREAARSVHTDGSFGNGAAMRAAVIGLLHPVDASARDADARLSAEITHAHPAGVEGAALIAHATAAALQSSSSQRPNSDEIVDQVAAGLSLPDFLGPLEVARTWLKGTEVPEPRTVRTQLGNEMTASRSCVTALYLALRHMADPFVELHRGAVALGGDVDTLSSMAGAIWGAANGADRLPPQQLEALEQRARIEALADGLTRVANRR